MTYPKGTKVIALINGIEEKKTLGDFVSYPDDSEEGTHKYYQVLDSKGERSSITSDIVYEYEIIEVIP